MAPPANQSVNWVDLGFKFLSILIIPIMAMGISVYTDVSVQKERVAQAQHRLDENQQQIEAITSRVIRWRSQRPTLMPKFGSFAQSWSSFGSGLRLTHVLEYVNDFPW